MKLAELKQVEAKARQEEYDSLSTEEKIARAEARPGNSARELAKLRKRLANREEFKKMAKTKLKAKERRAKEGKKK